MKQSELLDAIARERAKMPTVDHNGRPVAPPAPEQTHLDVLRDATPEQLADLRLALGHGSGDGGPQGTPSPPPSLEQLLAEAPLGVKQRAMAMAARSPTANEEEYRACLEGEMRSAGLLR